jgi:hypothetical protein
VEEAKKEPTLAERVAAAEKRTLEASNRREARQKNAELERALQRAEFTEILDRLEEEHGVEGKGLCKYITNSGKLIVMTAGQPTQMRKFRETKGTGRDCEVFVKPHVVYPDPEAYEEIIANEPGIRDYLANRLIKLYGVRHEENEEK